MIKRASNSANAATADGAPLSSAPAERQVPLGLGEERLLQGGRDLSEDGEGETTTRNCERCREVG